MKLSEIVDKMAIDLGASLSLRWKAEQKRQRRQRTQFLKRLYQVWGEPLSQLERLIVIATELGGCINSRLRAQEPCPDPFTVEVQTRLHARACQIAQEVLTLLSAGYADGAMGRWRSLHEVTVVAGFIGPDEDLAERYRLHEDVEALKAARRYSEYAVRLGCEPLSDTEIDQQKAAVAKLKQRFGQDYCGSYGWASGKLGKGVSFDRIEKAVGLNHLRPYYQLASHTVHGNPKGVFFRLGLNDQDSILLAGPSSIGLADAGQCTAISLQQITAGLIRMHPDIDNILVSKASLDLTTKICHSFARISLRQGSGRGS